MIRDEAEKIAASVNVGFDPISLITILLPMLMLLQAATILILE